MNSSVYHNKESKIISMIVLLLLTSTDTIIFGTNSNKSFIFIPRIFAVIGIVYLLFIINHGIIRSKFSAYAAVFFSIITIISGVVNNTDPLTIISRVLPIILAFSIVEVCPLGLFIRAFDKVLYFSALVSFVLYILCVTLPSLVQHFPLMINDAGITYYTIGIGSVLSTCIQGITSRMSGIFWEPGAFAIYLCIGLIFNMFFLKEINKKRISVYVAGIILTFSTTGIIGLLLICVVYLFQKSEKRNTNYKILIFILFIILIVVTFVLDSSFADIIFSKIINRTGTTSVRISSLVNGFQIAFDHPFLGVGGKSSEYMMGYAMRTGYGYNTMLTNTFVHQFANYGILFGSLFVLFTYKFFSNNKGLGRMVSLMLFVVIMLLYVGECFFSFLPFLFVFYGTNQRNCIMVGESNNENCFD